MNSSTVIALLVNVFNIAAVCVLAFFAIYGVLALIAKRRGVEKLRCGMFLQAFCIAALAAFAVEATVFNFQYYLKYFAGPELHTTEVSPHNPNVILTSDGTSAEVFIDNNALRITFKNLNRKVTSIFTNIMFNDNETVRVLIQWTDVDGTRNYQKTLYKYLPHENYSLLQPLGMVSELTVMFQGTNPEGSPVDLVSVSINKQIPFYFSGLRLFVMSFLFLSLFVVLCKKLRTKAAYYLFEYKFDSANKKQNIIYAFTITLLILFAWVCVYTTPYPHGAFLGGIVSQQYNVYLVDALIEGRAWLDYGTPERLLDAAEPYNVGYLSAHGYQHGVDWIGDWVWYKGKFYSYYGVVPAVILFVPYKLITGNYLSHQGAVFLFAAVAVFLLALLWRHCVRKYMPNALFAFYLLSLHKP